MRIAMALTCALVCGCYESATPAVRYERTNARVDYAGAEAGCVRLGGRLAREGVEGSLSAITAACAIGLPSDRTPCWTAIPIDRDGPALVLTVGPFQPAMGGFDSDAVMQPGQGFYAVCEIP